MIQRVGIAQALLNDPEVVFLDEPMSGLDPLGRRDVRSLILELRDQGRTVFFSSHILADAEALCSRVAVVAGRPAGGERPAQRHPGVPGPRLGAGDRRSAAGRARADCAAGRARATEISPRRYALELPLDAAPERLLSELIGHRRDARLAQSAARHARGLLRRGGSRRSGEGRARRREGEGRDAGN